MVRRLFYGLIWVLFILYAFFYAPPSHPETLGLITDLSTGHWANLNPWVISLFNGMGLWPMVYGAVLFRDGQRQSFPAWPFAVAAFFVGAFAILPYLALRQSSPETSMSEMTPIKFWESPGLGVGLLIGFILLFGFGISQGDWGAFTQDWFGDRFIHVMSLDFCLLSLLIPSLTIDDRDLRHTTSPVWLDFVPILGVLIYLCRRAPIQPNAFTEPSL